MLAKGLLPAKSDASNSHGSVPFLSQLGDVRVSHSRKEHTESGSLTCVMLAKSACCMLEQSSLCTWLCRCRKAGPAQLHNCGCKNINSAMYFDFLDPEASILVTPVPPDCSPSTLSSFIEEPTAHASPTVFKQDFTWEPSYNAEILPQPSPPNTNSRN